MNGRSSYYHHVHDVESCESCIDFFLGPQAKEPDSDADSGYCSGTAPTTTTNEEKPEQAALVIPGIVITPLSDDELRIHNACLRATMDQRGTFGASIDPSPYASRLSNSSKPASWSPSSSTTTSLNSRSKSSSTSSRVNLPFSTQPSLRPPEESYTRRIKDTWENRLAYPHYFPPPQIYSSRLNASLPSLLPSSYSASLSSSTLSSAFTSGASFNYSSSTSYSLSKNPSLISTEVAIKPSPLSPHLLRKRTSRDSIDAVRPDVLRRAGTGIEAIIRPTSPEIRSGFAKPVPIVNPNISTTINAPTPRVPNTLRKPQPSPSSSSSSDQIVRKRWSIAGSGVGFALSDSNGTSISPPPVHSPSSTSTTTPPTTQPNPKLPPHGLRTPRFRSRNDSVDSLSSIGSTTTLGSVISTATIGSTTSTTTTGGGGSAFGRGVGRFKRFMGIQSTAPSSFRML